MLVAFVFALYMYRSGCSSSKCLSLYCISKFLGIFYKLCNCRLVGLIGYRKFGHTKTKIVLFVWLIRLVCEYIRLLLFLFLSLLNPSKMNQQKNHLIGRPNLVNWSVFFISSNLHSYSIMMHVPNDTVSIVCAVLNSHFCNYFYESKPRLWPLKLRSIWNITYNFRSTLTWNRSQWNKVSFILQ